MLAKATQYINAVPSNVDDLLVEEQALQISINGQSFTITMRTPGDDRCLVAGLLYTEKIIRHADDILLYEERSCQNAAHRSYGDVHVTDEIAANANLAARSIASNSSCGLCGKTDASGLHYPEAPLEHRMCLEMAWLEEMQQLVSQRQPLFRATGGCHSAAAFSSDGTLLCVMEDIGRHNAVDKVIGYLLLNNQLEAAHLMSVSGRVSYEIVSKLYAANMPYLVSVSAPSSLAVEVCDAMGMTLISFCRGNKATVYTHNKAVAGEVVATE